jgi:hypothetical protein
MELDTSREVTGMKSYFEIIETRHHTHNLRAEEGSHNVLLRDRSGAAPKHRPARSELRQPSTDYQFIRDTSWMTRLVFVPVNVVNW